MWTGIADVFKVFETKQLEFPHPNRHNFIWFPSPAVGYSVMLDHNLQFPNSQNLKRGSKFLFLTDSLILKTTSPNEWPHKQYLHINSRRGPIGMLRKKVKITSSFFCICTLWIPYSHALLMHLPA